LFSKFNLAERRPKLNKLVKRVEFGLLIYQLVSILFIVNILPQSYWEMVFSFASILTVIASVLIIKSFLKKSGTLERYAMVAASFLVIGSIFDLSLVQIEKAGYWIPCDPHLPLLLCVFAEILTFTSGLTYKTRLLEINHLSAKNQLLLKQQEIQISQNELLELKSNISRDLHDDLGARLSLINITLQQYFIVDPETNKDNLIAKCSLLVKQTITYLREMMNEMHGPPTVNEGYLSSIKKLVNSIQNVNPIQFYLNHSKLENFNNPSLEYHLYKITQELINNTLKYANADTIHIDISIHKSQLMLFYEDNGVGFNPQNVKRGSGLLNIEERVNNLYGESIIESSEKKGFCCKIYVPI
ncbi:MAG: ATP-binding protein, partial [Bacteroidia bacterium]